jgi:RimJ/RimL family protein N-acetyltransferase
MLMSNNEEDQLKIQLSSDDQRLRTIVPSDYVALVPLTTDHAPAYFNQYHSTGIQEMTDLPILNSVSDVYKWIEEEAETKNSYNYAIILPVTGFVGFVNLIVSKHAAFFAIWLGEKFQGLGLGTQTAQIICQHALDAEISVIFTASFVNNQRSIQMLKKVGFETLPISAYAPHNDRIFLILTNDPSIKRNGNNELIDFYQREDLPHKFYPNPIA